MGKGTHQGGTHPHNQGDNRGGNQRGSWNLNNKPLILTTPYNFVPLQEQVVRPAWAPVISQDKPFTDSQSGELTLTIKAIQPIFTRNSVSRRVTNEDRKKELGSHFSKNIDNKYFIPGSSIKGTIRNVLEIMSFGDLAKGLNDEIWGMRDLTLDAYKNLFGGHNKIYCGRLKKDENGEYVIEDCGLPHRITHEQIDAHYGENILSKWVSSFKKSNDPKEKSLAYNFSKGTAQIKKALFNGKSLDETFTIDGDAVTGRLVFTGQPAIKYDGNKGTIQVKQGESYKYKEFIFGDVKENISVNDEVIKAFEFAYGRLNLTLGQKKEVFFHKNGIGEIVSFGLAYMYKIPFTHSVKEAIETYQKDSGRGPDLAACIFGHTEKNNALKGRVVFGHAFAEGQPQVEGVKNEVLNSPKATYYPTYVKQTINDKGKITTPQYKTLFDHDAIPSGWKRYPVHGDVVKENPGPLINGQRNKKIQTKFRPLQACTTFSCTVNYHNLKKIELGALLSALTFHETKDCYHTLGMAKPLGFGKCTIEVSGLDEKLKQEYLCAYEKYMEKQLRGQWLNSDQLKEFLSMSQDQQNAGRSELVYMKDVKNFAKAKTNKLALDLYTKLDNIKSVSPKKICQAIPEDDAITQECQSESFAIQFEEMKRVLLTRLKEQQRSLVESKEKVENKIEEESAGKENDEPQIYESEKIVKPEAKKNQVESIDATNLRIGDVIFADLIKINKPFAEVKLLLTKYSFDVSADLTGLGKIKNPPVEGQIVRCSITSITKEGKISLVKYLP